MHKSFNAHFGPTTKHIEPKKDKVGAEKFFKKYAGLFMVLGKGLDASGNPTVSLKTCDKERVVVSKRPDGIYVDNVKFVDEW